MKKLKIWSFLLLAVLMIPLVASCGGDDSEKEENDYQKFFRLANINQENYEPIYFNQISDSYLEFDTFEKDTEIFHIWLFNRINNKIVEYYKLS